jgi:hypothetical protein
MAEPNVFGVRDRPHLSIDAFRETAEYALPARAQARKPLRQDYAAHAASLLDQLTAALGLPAAGADARVPLEGLKLGTIVEVATLLPAENSRTKAVKVPAALEFPGQEVMLLRTKQ